MRLTVRDLRKIIRETLVETSLGGHQMATYGPRRFDTFLDMIQDEKPFELTPSAGAKQIWIKQDSELKSALKTYDIEKVNDALSKVEYIDTDGKTYRGLSLNKIQKTSEFGGKGNLDQTLSYLNETGLAESINKFVQKTGRTIVLKIGSTTIRDVMGAEHVGKRRADKGGDRADVLLTRRNGSTYGISIKLKTAANFLSGDRALVPIAKPIIMKLLSAEAPNARLVRRPKEDRYYAVIGSQHATVEQNFKFNIPNDWLEFALFGKGPLRADLVAKGDFLSEPAIHGSTLSWPAIFAWESIDDVPNDDRPVGLIRHTGEPSGYGIRGITIDGKKFPGIRLVVVSAARGKPYPEVG